MKEINKAKGEEKLKKYALLKKALWELFCEYNKGLNCEIEEQGYSYKKLTREEKEIIYNVKSGMPSLQEIMNLAIHSIEEESPRLLKPKYIKAHFCDCVVMLEERAYTIYLKHEQELFLSAIETWISQKKNLIEKISTQFPDPSEFTKEVCKHFYPIIQRIEFESSQTRKARGGKTFEHIIEYLLKKINIKCEKPSREARKVLKRIDLVIPDQQTALKRPDKALFLSCKRTLRERWKQTIPERKPSWRVFLLTVDEDLPEDKAIEINNLGMIVYVKDEIKDKIYLREKEWIRKLSELPNDIGGR